MKDKQKKLLTIGSLLTLSSASIYLINRIVETYSLLKGNLKKDPSSDYYHWRFGNIYYTKTGKGKPILLIHELTPGGSGFEWYKVIDELTKNHTVYYLDLPGCGRSDKPKITYTNYIYMQLLTDFIRDIIKEPTDVVASGLSSSFTVLAAKNETTLFNKIVLVNPTSLVQLSQIPTGKSKIKKGLLETPVLGTFLYNILFSNYLIQNQFLEEYFYNPFHLDQKYIDIYYESAHMNHCNGKYLYSSIEGNFLNFNIINGLKGLENDVCIIGGKYEPGINEIMEDYQYFNPAIDTYIIEDSKHYPQIEKAQEISDYICQYIED